MRSHLRAAAALFLFGALLTAQSLRDLSAKRSIRFGTAVNPAALSDPAYAATLAREFNQAEPENSTKFGPIHPAPDTYNFGPADAIVEYARAHDMAVRGHTLVWHNQNPTWVSRGDFTPEQLAEVLDRHIASVVGHFAGKIYAWDVVNEAFNEDGSLRSTVWYDKPGIGRKGTGYIEQAFRWAHAADPKALLFYNDYDAEAVNPKSDAIYNMVRDLKSRGVPIHGVGLQMHLTDKPPLLDGMETNIRRLTDLGLEVQITELDVRLPADAAGVPAPGMLETQARIYGDLVSLCVKFPKCTAIQTWGFTDRHSWIPGWFRGTGAALPFDRDYKPKAAYESIRKALAPVPPDHR